MYKKNRNKQLAFEHFDQPLGLKLNPDNRWVKEYDKKMNISPLAETWECSTHPDGASFVASGVMEGHSLVEPGFP